MSEHTDGRLPDWTKLWMRDSGVLVVSQFATVVVTSTLAVLIARTLGPADWGIFSGFLGLSMALSAFVGLGLATWLLRELSALWSQDGSDTTEARSEAGRLLSGAVALNICLGTGLVLSAFIATRLMGWDAERSLALVSLTGYTALLATSGVLEAVFRSRRALRSVVAATLLEKGVLLALVALSLIAGGGLAGIALSYIVAGTVRTTFNGLSIVIWNVLRFSVPSPRTAWELTGRSLPFALNAASLNMIPRLDTFLVAILSTTSAGYFAVGDRVVGPALFISASATSALYPFLARQQEGGGWKVAGLLGLAGAALAIGGAGAAPWLVPLVFGAEYGSAVRTVQVMIFVLPFTFLAGGLMAWLYSNGLEKRVLLVSVVAGISGTGAIVAGHAFAGATGAGFGYLLRQVILAVALAGLAFSYNRTLARRTANAGDPTPGWSLPPSREDAPVVQQ